MFTESTDQLGNKIKLHAAPRSIISLVPSQTELLFYLGLDEQITGITRFCIHPAKKVAGKVKIGGTKKFDIEKIKSLQPDLIIGNKEENYEQGIELLRKDFTVWMSDIYTLEDACAMMLELGRITDREQKAKELVATINNGLHAVFSNDIKSNSGKTCAYFIWRKPYMVAGGNTFINHMLKHCGFHNVFGQTSRYPEIDPAELTVLKPDYVFLSSEPYAFGEKHFEEFKNWAPGAKVVLVNGEMFSWYGSRLLGFADYYTNTLKNQL